MKRVKKISIFLLPVLLFACGNSSSPVSKNTASSGTEQTSPSSGDASFSATVDNTPVSGGEIDEMQLTNTAFIYPGADNNSKRLLFFLNSTKKGDDFYSFRFSIPDKEGVYQFTGENHGKLNCTIWLDFNLKSADNFARYDQDSVTVAITKITSSRISGNFSGRLTLSNDTRSKPYKSKVIISDGKFDIPFSTGNLRPE